MQIYLPGFFTPDVSSLLFILSSISSLQWFVVQSYVFCWVIFHNFLVTLIFQVFISLDIITLYSISAIWSLYGLVLLFLFLLIQPHDGLIFLCFYFFWVHIHQNFIYEKAWRTDLNMIFTLETQDEWDFVYFCWMAETLPSRINFKSWPKGCFSKCTDNVNTDPKTWLQIVIEKTFFPFPFPLKFSVLTVIAKINLLFCSAVSPFLLFILFFRVSSLTFLSLFCSPIKTLPFGDRRLWCPFWEYRSLLMFKLLPTVYFRMAQSGQQLQYLFAFLPLFGSPP